MPKYEITVTTEQTYTITAKSAKDAFERINDYRKGLTWDRLKSRIREYSTIKEK